MSGHDFDPNVYDNDIDNDNDNASVQEAVAAGRSGASENPRQTRSSKASGKPTGNKLRGEHLGIGHLDIQHQQNIVSAVKEGAFYREKQRDAWIGGMTTAFVLFVGFAIGGFFFYKSKINDVVDEVSNLSDADKKKLMSDIGSFDAVQMLWYLGWGIFSFLIGYIIYFFSVKNWRRRQMTISKQLASTDATRLASKGRYVPSGNRPSDRGPIGSPLSPSGYRKGSQSMYMR